MRIVARAMWSTIATDVYAAKYLITIEIRTNNTPDTINVIEINPKLATAIKNNTRAIGMILLMRDLYQTSVAGIFSPNAILSIRYGASSVIILLNEEKRNANTLNTTIPIAAKKKSVSGIRSKAIKQKSVAISSGRKSNTMVFQFDL
jgi:hypothetical protein